MQDLIEVKQLTQTNIKDIRDSIAKEQNNKCLLCGCELTDKIAVLDHQHKVRKSDPNVVDGNGLVRGVLCSECNALEGKIFNNSTRFLHYPTKEKRIEFLAKLIEYYNREPYPYIHPSEKVKEKDVSKSNFNKLKKLYALKYPKKKPLEYPKSKKLTKQLEVLFKEFEICPYNAS